jgi:polyphosphate kinase
MKNNMQITTEKYYNRDLSWLSFNHLVLKQIKDKKLPLFERIKFLAIYSSNLDEFYKVRVASYRSLFNLYKDRKEKEEKAEAAYIIEEINERIKKQQTEYETVFFNEIIPELENEGIILYRKHELDEKHKEFVQDFFHEEVLPFIQPVLLSRSGNVLSFLQDNVIYLALKMFKKSDKEEQRPYYAVVKNPTHHLPRFIQSNDKYFGKYLIFFLEDIVKLNLHAIFPGYRIENIHSIKVSRNADYMIDDEFSGNLFEKIRDSIRKRKTGFPARFAYDRDMPEDLLNVLQMAFNIADSDLVESGPVKNFDDFFSFPNPVGEHLELTPLHSLKHKVLEKYESVFQAVKKQDVLLHFPYHSYDYVLRFFNQAALDPTVEQIKTTQYRVATNSAVVNALITAARNNKKVTVFVELKARFDEKANMHFARLMQEAGINVIASIPGLKVHSKAALVVRKPKKKTERKALAFISTGNFNEKTAKQYCDEGFFTSDKRITSDLEKMFYYLEAPLEQFNFRHLLVPRFNFLDVLFRLLDDEVRAAREGKPARVILKVNGLQDHEVIEKLYETGQNGVQTDLLVRGVCSLRPRKDFSPNIQITRIVDRFLEHSRIFAFYNGGDWKVYLSTADLMYRNLRRRVEIAVPVFDKNLRDEIIDILEIQLKDNTKAKFLDADINNIDKPAGKNDEEYRAQIDTYLYLQKKVLMGQ